MHNWQRKAEEIACSDVIGMRCTPYEFASRCEERERRWDARVGRSLIVALPKEVSDEERWRLAKGYALSLRDRYGCAAFVAVHRPGDTDRSRDNHHAHFVLSTRRVDDDKLTAKIRVLDNARTARAEVEWMRFEWERRVNALLVKRGISPVSRAAVVHRPAARKLSPMQAAMERRGISTRIGKRNRALRNLAAALDATTRQLEELTGERHSSEPSIPPILKRSPRQVFSRHIRTQKRKRAL